ncbi:hypothetical protein AK812_SmicGene18177 [Symbiodinium microadriaticum]|uniref:Uncharacterized protein n=1 Tax=Symbiodinium microadriaticum TaxID=2951 RepID=A0A1Q9DVT0_SYMMI|nr:hypothetical protein AK812_SmicGene18177 [Symbiodinium microadriaticum]
MTDYICHVPIPYWHTLALADAEPREGGAKAAARGGRCVRSPSLRTKGENPGSPKEEPLSREERCSLGPSERPAAAARGREQKIVLGVWSTGEFIC